MRLLLSAVLVLTVASALSACGPSAQEQAAQEQERARQQAASQPKPTPKPGSWMYDPKQRNTSLEKKP